MAEVDTSSYPKASNPNILDTVGKLQGLEQGNIAIDQGKLKLINDRYGIVSKELQGLYNDPDVDFKKVSDRFQNLVNLGLIPAPMMAQAMKDVPTDRAQIPQWIKMKAVQGQAVHDAINATYGAPTLVNNEQQLIPARQGAFVPGGIQRTGGKPFQIQSGPSTPVIGANNQPQLLGPQAEQPTPGSLPVGPITNPAINGPSANFGGNVTGATVEKPTLPVAPVDRVAQGFPAPRGPVTGFPPGVKEAQTATGETSGRQLAEARARSASYQRDIFPLNEAIPALEKLGTKGTGPGTETINHIKSFLLSNLPGLKEDEIQAINNIKDYDKAKKYLTDFVNQTGSTGTNDKLAAAFAGNPSVNISNAAAIDVAKSALALRKMQQAQVLHFGDTGLGDHQFAQWASKNTNALDPRAFGIDQMSPTAQTKLRAQLEKNPKERERFEKSYLINKKYIMGQELTPEQNALIR